MKDDFDLERFERAQAPIYESVLEELRRGRKTSHWMWFIFPQIAGLGSSPTAVKFAIRSRAEAESYLAHPVLGPRLTECSGLVLKIAGADADQVFGYPDNLKFHSSMTLFAAVASASERAEQSVFGQALAKYFGGRQDDATIKLLG